MYRGASCLPISVENLMMFGSMHVKHFQSAGYAKPDRDESLRKLTSQFFPLFAPSCGLEGFIISSDTFCTLTGAWGLHPCLLHYPLQFGMLFLW